MQDLSQFKMICRLCLAVSAGLTLQGIPWSPALADGMIENQNNEAINRTGLPTPSKYITKSKSVIIQQTRPVLVKPAQRYVVKNQAVTVHRAYISTAPGPVKFAGEEVFSIPTPAGGFTAEERSMIVERNLNNALLAADDRSPDAVQIEIINSLPVIRLGCKHVVTVDTLLADAYHTSCGELANVWAGNLRHVLTDSEKVSHYIAQMDGNYLFHPYSQPAWRERWQAARLNHAANSYRKDMPRNLVSSQSLKDQGFQLMMNRDPAAAEAFFRAALVVDSENERARYGLGLAQLKQGSVERALMNLGMARHLEPDDAQVHIAIGQALESMGHDQEAIASYKTALGLQPENPEAALYVADLREERDQIGRSSMELSQAMLGCPDSEFLRLRKKDQVAWRLSKPY